MLEEPSYTSRLSLVMARGHRVLVVSHSSEAADSESTEHVTAKSDPGGLAVAATAELTDFVVAATFDLTGFTPANSTISSKDTIKVVAEAAAKFQTAVAGTTTPAAGVDRGFTAKAIAAPARANIATDIAMARAREPLRSAIQLVVYCMAN